jgi:hypothetical protein
MRGTKYAVTAEGFAGRGGEKFRTTMPPEIEAVLREYENPSPLQPRSNIPVDSVLTETAVPCSEWSRTARVLGVLSQPGDVGLGDVVVRIVKNSGKISLDRFYMKLTGEPYGCQGKQVKLNKKFPLI